MTEQVEKVTSTSSTGQIASSQHLSSSSLSAPSDVTLKFTDGATLKAHRAILANASPVFNSMLYGEFKEGKSDVVDLLEEDSRVMNLLIDFVYKGNCEADSLDDVLTLAKLVDYYQVNNIPFYHMCGELILAQLNASNYLTLLPKFAGVMNKECLKKVADKVMCYTNGDFISKFDETKDLPEEVLLVLLQRDDISTNEVGIFDFLVKWHEYQTTDLDKALNLTSKLFKCIRFALINPRVLTSKVAACKHVDKQLIIESLDCIYNKPLDECHDCKCGECDQQSDVLRRPRCLDELSWSAQYGGNVTLAYSKNTYRVSYNPTNSYYGDVQVVYSEKLKNGIYSFTVSNNTNTVLTISNSAAKFNVNGCTVTIFVCDNYLFLKTINTSNNTICTYTTSIPGNGSCSLGIHVNNANSANFNITSKV